MNLDLSEMQTMLQDTLGRAFKDVASSHRAAEKAGLDATAWQVFTGLGLPLLRVEERLGGAGLGLLDAILVAESVAENLALIPANDAIVCAGLLAVLETPLAMAALEELGQGKIVALALHDAVHSPQQLIAFGAAAKAILFRQGNEVRLMRPGAVQREPNIGGLPTARIDLAGASSEVLAEGYRAAEAFEAAREEWKLLNAAALVAMGGRALKDAAAYARDRHAFGRPIGSYQGLAHPLADASAEIDGAGLLIRRTVEAIGTGRSDAAALVGMCSWWASETAPSATTKAMRVFGGYGMTMEYDAQAYFRRATALRLLGGDPQAELQTIADRLWADISAPLPAAGEVGITFEYGASADAARDAAEAVFAKHVTPELQRWAFESTDGYDPVLYAALASEGLLFPDWPTELGGGAGAFERAAVHDVFVRHLWPQVVVATTDMLGKMILHFGSERAKAEILPRLASGQTAGALCYSEPSCGSDIFAARTRAVRDGDDWIIDGQKIFTSQGHIAEYGLLIARTGVGEKHASVTVFAVPLDQPGYACNPMDTVGDELTNTTFYENVRVPDAYRLGGVNEGTRVLAAALAIEQGAAEHWVAALDEMLAAGVEWARTAQRAGRNAIDMPSVRARLAAVATRMQVLDVLSRRTVWAGATGQARKHYGPMAKLFGSESWVKCGSDLMEMAAPDTLLQGYSALGRIEKLYRRSVPSTIYAGSSEIQRSLIAEAGLGLPRSRS
jgi:alkylation response protein AidB-like acyl-CoA dehydrogenase